jgi:hypothetical protein
MFGRLRESWRKKVTGSNDHRHGERRTQERRKQQMPFNGPERRSGKDRRQYVRQVMSGEASLPDQERRSTH